jgi:hypothetical protein
MLLEKASSYIPPLIKFNAEKSSYTKLLITLLFFVSHLIANPSVSSIPFVLL